MNKLDVANRRLELLGKEFETNGCGKCVIVDYKGWEDVFVQFYQYPNVVRCHMDSLKKGKVLNKLFPTYLGKGYIGIGAYDSVKDKEAYSLWSSMLGRAYCKKYHKKRPTYENVIVCSEWLNFQNFAEWYYKQPFFNAKDYKGKPYQLDKDILFKGNKVYSPETCCFVPPEINSLLVKGNNIRGKYLIGVRFNKKLSKYQADVRKNGDKVYLGLYNTEIEAFQAYKKAKESYIKEVSCRWKDKIDEKVYKALLVWEIEEND